MAIRATLEIPGYNLKAANICLCCSCGVSQLWNSSSNCMPRRWKSFSFTWYRVHNWTFQPFIFNWIKYCTKYCRISDIIPVVSYLIFRGSSFEFFATPPLDQTLTPRVLCRHTRICLVSNWWRSHKLIGGGCEVKVRNWDQITDYWLYRVVKQCEKKAKLKALIYSPKIR